MKIKKILLISITAIICFLLVYYLGDLWLFDMAPGKENGGEVSVNTIRAINHKL